MADLRNVYSRRDVLKAGFERYAPVGMGYEKADTNPPLSSKKGRAANSTKDLVSSEF
jgi:hypothetical protein